MALCEQPCAVFSRIVGYLSPLNQWNIGKTAEAEDRLEYKVPTETGRTISEQTKPQI